MGIIDIHTHMLPGIDDGAEDIKTSLSMIRRSYNSGVTDIILTPHYNEFRNYTADPKSYFEALKKAIAEEKINVTLHLGNEVRYSSNTISLLKSKEVLTLAGSYYVLTEFSTASTYDFIRNAVHELSMRGYNPIIAHIERYSDMYSCNYDKLNELRSAGVLFQVNASSVINGSFSLRRFIKKLIKYDMLDFIASDCHDLKRRIPELDTAYAYISQKYGSDYAKRLFSDNPEMIINNTKID